jgi:hypothetical protein
MATAARNLPNAKAMVIILLGCFSAQAASPDRVQSWKRIVCTEEELFLHETTVAPRSTVQVPVLPLAALFIP